MVAVIEGHDQVLLAMIAVVAAAVASLGLVVRAMLNPLKREVHAETQNGETLRSEVSAIAQTVSTLIRHAELAAARNNLEHAELLAWKARWDTLPAGTDDARSLIARLEAIERRLPEGEQP